ncbi:hypothetical protein VHEMI04894 [[Torrubiella] hemipterigena]|uniref:Uncharacterized protein n=1 Tax=[Torrubiella] hemipterigena TaxID=1531966 RepID=A0A0A1TF73_9HYPO|nr:hypothetical protein VHEMI04894 [[Torrubiella] hemipterigena]
MEQSNGEGQHDLRHKRKADSQDNERLSKRLSLLNIEHDGTKLYVPVEKPRQLKTPSSKLREIAEDDDSMHLDDTKHKVYIYNIDDELSSEDEDDSKLIFIPDIEKRLKETRIPPSILANKDGELAGMQVVLYSDPKSLTVPEEKDGVRKAILDARRRLRAKQGGADDNGAAEKVPETSSESRNIGDSMEMD